MTYQSCQVLNDDSDLPSWIRISLHHTAQCRPQPFSELDGPTRVLGSVIALQCTMHCLDVRKALVNGACSDACSSISIPCAAEDASHPDGVPRLQSSSCVSVEAMSSTFQPSVIAIRVVKHS